MAVGGFFSGDYFRKVFYRAHFNRGFAFQRFVFLFALNCRNGYLKEAEIYINIYEWVSFRKYWTNERKYQYR